MNYEPRLEPPKWTIAIRLKNVNEMLTVGVDDENEAKEWQTVLQSM